MGATALHNAVSNGNAEMVTFLIESNAIIEIKDNLGYLGKYYG